MPNIPLPTTANQRSRVMPQSWRESGPLPPEGGVPTRDGTPPSGGSGIKPAVTEALPQETELHSSGFWRKSIESFLSQHGISPEELLRPPAPADPTCRSYCPRCLAQFTTNEGEC